MIFPKILLLDDSNPETAITCTWSNLVLIFACLDTLMTPPIVFEPKSSASGPRMILTVLKEAISKLVI